MSVVRLQPRSNPFNDLATLKLETMALIAEASEADAVTAYWLLRQLRQQPGQGGKVLPLTSRPAR